MTRTEYKELCLDAVRVLPLRVPLSGHECQTDHFLPQEIRPHCSRDSRQQPLPIIQLLLTHPQQVK